MSDAPPRPIRFPLVARILVLLVGIAALSILASAVLSFATMGEIRTTARDSNERLGQFAVSNSSDTLTLIAEESLQRRAHSQAALIDAVFDRVTTETQSLAEIASVVLSDPLDNIPRVRDDANAPSNDPKLHASVNFAPGVTADDVRINLNRSGGLDTPFCAICSNDPVILAAHVATSDGLELHYPGSGGWSKDYDPRTRSWYLDATHSGKASWSGPYTTNGQLVVACTMPFHGAGGVLLGVVKVDVTIATIDQTISETRVGQNGYVFLLGANSEVIASQQMEALRAMSRLTVATIPSGQDGAREAKTYFPVLLMAKDPDLAAVVSRMVAGESSFAHCMLSGVPYAVAYAPVTDNGWSIGIVMPIAEILAPAHASAEQLQAATISAANTIDNEVGRSQWQMGLLFVLTLLITGWAALVLARRIVRPIHELSVGASRFGKGQLDLTLNVRTGDEIERLAGDFNAMAANLRTYIANLDAATSARHQAENELLVAKKIQSSLLPRIFPPFPNRTEIELYALMVPAREVGGDFFDFFFIDHDRLCLAIGDVSDKGVPASLFMAVTKTLIKTEAMQPGRTVADILSRVNDQLCSDNEMLMFVTVFLAIVDLRDGTMESANAGHNPAVISRVGGDIAYMKPAKGVALGVMEGARFKTGRDTLGPGDVLFIYTDGINEAMNAKREQFTYDRLLATLGTSITHSAAAITDEMRGAVARFAGGYPQSDDITMITLRFQPHAVAAVKTA